MGSAYGLLLLVVIRSVTLDDLLLTLFGEALAVAVDVYSGGASLMRGTSWPRSRVRPREATVPTSRP
ncbi:MAG: hypothetical protein ACLSWS_16740 [Faecalispora jeddahensis]